MTAESTTAPPRREPELAGQTVVVIGGTSDIEAWRLSSG